MAYASEFSYVKPNLQLCLTYSFFLRKPVKSLYAMKPLTKTVYFTLFCWLSCQIGLAQDTITISRHLNLVNITTRTEWLYDGSKKIQPYRLNDNHFQWQKKSKPFFYLEKQGRYWLRFTLYNEDTIPLNLILISVSIDVSKMRLYTVSRERIDSSMVTGSAFPASKRLLKNAELCLPGFFLPKENYTCYLYLERGINPSQTSLFFCNPSSPPQIIDFKSIAFQKGFTIGLAFLYCLIALLVFILFPELINVAYFFYTLGGLGYLSASMGIGMWMIWSEYPYFEEIAAGWFAAIQFIGLIVMARIVLKTSLRYRILDWVLLLTLLIGTLYIFITGYRYLFPLLLITYISLFACFSLVLSLLIITLIAFWNYYRFREWESLWFIGLFSFIILFALVLILSQLGIITLNEFINNWLPHLSILFETTLVTLFVVNYFKNQLWQRQLRELEVQLQRQRELERIASDLHDDIGSTLSSISILSESYLRSGQVEVNKFRFGDLGDKARAALESISDIVWSVNPENDSMEKLLSRMTRYASEILEGIDVELFLDVEVSFATLAMPMEQRKDFYLIFKEAINNVAKYSEATQVWVKLSKPTQEIYLEIKDNGKGFDVEKVKQGNGLKNMTNRAERLGGKLQIESAVGKGTSIKLNIPFN